MMDFFRSCYSWFMENYDNVLVTVTSAQFFSFIYAVVLLIKNFRATKDNVASSETLNKALDKNNAISGDVSVLKNKITSLEKDKEELHKKLTHMEESFTDAQEGLMKKINCMLEVQSIVYSTIKDDEIRKSVNCILTNAKYTETATRAKLKEEIANLREKLEEEAEKVREITEKTTDKITQIVEPNNVNYAEYVRY